MKHSIHINQRQALQLGIKNLTQGHIFDMLTGASTWAAPEVVDGEVYYWVSRQRISEQLPLADLKPDTIYRNLKKLSELGLIDYIKVGKKDCVRLTQKGKTYYVGSRSGLEENTMSDLDPNNDENSDLNPRKLGSKSEKHSDLNPTYKSINNISPISDKAKNKSSDSEVAARRVANHLHKKLTEEIPEASTVKPESWITEIERAIRLDGRTEEQLINIIDWIYSAGTFWIPNIQSGKKLREKYVTMVAQSRRPSQDRKPANDFNNTDYSEGTEGFITHG
ncbi:MULTISPECIES: helix-turn-helix domain-containing protein [unclassified Methylophaga]|uniref:helix-turn-helix domain-containing protein n=1 Tax=unclassified Methylophaga TaxID=2629249 RepID=UPI00259CB823|nr:MULTISPECIES: helix-turn-helix domain-containing protein [unclassified Methylophaga]